MSNQQPGQYHQTSLSSARSALPSDSRCVDDDEKSCISLCLAGSGLALFLIPVLSVIVSLLVQRPITAPIGVNLFPVCLPLSFVLSLAGMILSAWRMASGKRGKQITISLILSILAVCLSLAMALLYLVVIFSGFS